MIVCVDCGIEAQRLSSSHKRCEGCARISRSRVQARWHRRNRRHVREYAARYYDQNTETASSRKARWYQETAEERRAYSARYRRENKAKVKEQRLVRRERDLMIDTGRSGNPWSPAEDALIESWAGTARELAAALGRTRGAVDARKFRLRSKGLLA